MPAADELAQRRVDLVLEHMRLENEYDFPGCIGAFARPRYEVMATGETHDGSGGVESFLLENRTAFPDFHFEAHRTVAAGEDTVLVEGTFTGTQLGAWRGLPPTKRKITLPMAVLFEFEGENLVCERLYFDLGTALRQLGVARDPTSLGGRLTALFSHPVTIGRAFLGQRRRGVG